MKTILVPVDFSPATERVVARALVLARRLGARLLLLNVTSPAALLEDHRKLAELAERVLKRPADGSGANDRVAGEALEFIGDPARVILDEARHFAADYIVMGAPRAMRMSKRPPGGIAGRVMRDAPCPVMLVRASHARSRTAKMPGERVPAHHDRND